MVAGEEKGGRVNPKQDDSGCKFQIKRGTNLDYDMLCKPKSTDNK